MKNALTLLALAYLLVGCAGVNLAGQLQNRVTTTLDCQRGFLASLYGPLGMTSEIDRRDVAMLPCGRALAVPAAPVAAPAASAAK
jgi:hypothetical protein